MFTRSRPWFCRPEANRALLLSIAGLLLFAISENSSFAFPELVRHGYGNCVSCHVSPTGGGILTEYGRQLSREVLSTWGREGEEAFIFGKTPKWLLLGGDLRTLNLRQDTLSGSQDSLILMQGDLEVALNSEKWALVGTVGRLDTAIYPQGSSWISRRHFLIFRPGEEFSIRAGRFNRAFGINTADHFTTVKQGLDWDQGTETYALEGAWLNEKYNVYATADFGRPDEESLDREKGASATGSVFLGGSYKVGASYFYGTNDVANRHVFGPWGILGFSPHVFFLTELDFQRKFAFNFVDPQWGLANYSRLDFELVQGVHVFGTAEVSKLDFGDAGSRLLRYGTGVQLFPRPHFEFEFEWQTQQVLSVSSDFENILWFMIHYYL